MKLLSILFLVASFSAVAEDNAFYSVSEKNFQGKEYKFSEHKGKVTLIVNIASQCGYTPQLKGLQNLYQKYKSKNLILVGVPSNEFGGQTPEGDKEMKALLRIKLRRKISNNEKVYRKRLRKKSLIQISCWSI